MESKQEEKREPRPDLACIAAGLGVTVWETAYQCVFIPVIIILAGILIVAAVGAAVLGLGIAIMYPFVEDFQTALRWSFFPGFAATALLILAGYALRQNWLKYGKEAMEDCRARKTDGDKEAR